MTGAPDDDLAGRIEAAAGSRPSGSQPLAGGCIADVVRVDLENGERVVAKRAPAGGLAIEAWMLAYLARRSDLPVPQVIVGDDDLLVMTWIDGPDRLDADAERHAAELLAALHAVEAEAYGLERDTLIGPLAQPNPWTDDWRSFFGEHRLVYMARIAHERGRLPDDTLAKVERLAGDLGRHIERPGPPSLLHGDMWSGNVLVRDGRIAGFVDPAVYHGDAEIELAFSTLFGTFGRAFFERYHELRPLAPGFFEVRCDLYNLYPLLVHAALFGGPYPAQVARIAERLA